MLVCGVSIASPSDCPDSVLLRQRLAYVTGPAPGCSPRRTRSVYPLCETLEEDRCTVSLAHRVGTQDASRSTMPTRNPATRRARLLPPASRISRRATRSRAPRMRRHRADDPRNTADRYATSRSSRGRQRLRALRIASFTQWWTISVPRPHASRRRSSSRRSDASSSRHHAVGSVDAHRPPTPPMSPRTSGVLVARCAPACASDFSARVGSTRRSVRVSARRSPPGRLLELRAARDEIVSVNHAVSSLRACAGTPPSPRRQKPSVPAPI